MMEDELAVPTDLTQDRVLLILTSHTYRAGAFMEAAERLGVEIVQAVDLPRQLADFWGVSLGIDLGDMEGSSNAIVAYALEHPLKAILAIDDSGALLAARACAALNLPHNSVEAAEAARNKHRMRQLLSKAGVASPHFQLFSTADGMPEIISQTRFPSVVKPLMLSGSRGVIRVNDEDQLTSAVDRLRRILEPMSQGPYLFLVEEFIPGVEVALEGLLDRGELKVLALFDKPDPLDGPYFEETIYVTPSRLDVETQEAIASCTAQAARAIGLRTGPIHAELRVNQQGPWIVEIAGRSIGGLCSRTLRFGAGLSLEELILRQACGLGLDDMQREQDARGVMMIPIPAAGLLRRVEGIERARELPLIEDVEITARLNYPLVPLPEGESYLGFIFARGDSPAAVELALREAHRQLSFVIEPVFTLAATF